MTTALKEKEVITLPDFYSHAEMAKFVTFLEDNSERYGVKSLLYYSKMILSHLERIERHAANANKILVRVNGSITEAQRKFYNRRALETVAKKFYSAVSDRTLDAALDAEGFVYSTIRHYTREMKEQALVAIHVKKELGSKGE